MVPREIYFLFSMAVMKILLLLVSVPHLEECLSVLLLSYVLDPTQRDVRTTTEAVSGGLITEVKTISR